jgi:hypothetical protein
VRLLFYFLNYFSIKIWRKGRDERVELFEKPLSSKTVREIEMNLISFQQELVSNPYRQRQSGK